MDTAKMLRKKIQVTVNLLSMKGITSSIASKCATI